jgi:hypothetical protein
MNAIEKYQTDLVQIGLTETFKKSRLTPLSLVVIKPEATFGCGSF